MSNIEKKGFIHGDLKPENILMFKKKPKLTDFGFSVPVNEKEYQLKKQYTLPYSPYELLMSRIKSTKTDSFALGVILIIIFNE